MIHFKKEVFSERGFVRGLVSYLRFNNNLSCRVASAFGQFTYTPTYITGVVNNAIYFPNTLTAGGCVRGGTSYTHSMTDSETEVDCAFSFTQWVKWEQISSSTVADIFSKSMLGRGISQGEYECSVINETGIIRFVRISQYNRFSDYKTTFSNIPLIKNEWVHLAITSDGVAVKIYINAVDVTANTVTTGNYITMKRGYDTLAYGNTPDPRNYFHRQFFGAIDEAAVWKGRELSQFEIEQIMNSTLII